jgi:hypothetical protein
MQEGGGLADGRKSYAPVAAYVRTLAPTRCFEMGKPADLHAALVTEGS